jgi:hypothetical protein
MVMDKTQAHKLQLLIRKTNGGDVFLREDVSQQKLRIVSTGSRRLPRFRQLTTSFDGNVAFQKAVARRRPYAVFNTPSGNFLVVPTHRFASIWDLAHFASPEQVRDLFNETYRQRRRLEEKTGEKWWIETIGFDVPHLHIRLVRKRSR